MFTNIILLLITTTATLAAFGGDTWRQGRRPLLLRITIRGWISLLCLFAAVVLGIAKEINAQNESRGLQRERDEAKAKLEGLRDQLASTKEQLINQTKFSILAVLSKDYHIEGCGWLLTFRGSSCESRDIIEYLATNISPKYRAVVIVTLVSTPFMLVYSSVQYRYDGANIVTQKEKNGTEFEIELPSFLNTSSGYAPPEESESSLWIFQDLRKGDNTDATAAIGYRDLNTKKRSIARIQLSFEKEFSTKDEVQTFLRQNQQLKAAKIKHPNNGHLLVEFSMPPEIQHSFSEYWKANLQDSKVELFLDGSSYLEITCDAAKMETTETESGVVLSLMPNSDPIIELSVLEE
jgi:hypothetical protein